MAPIQFEESLRARMSVLFGDFGEGTSFHHRSCAIILRQNINDKPS
jgi:hypothetical protein